MTNSLHQIFTFICLFMAIFVLQCTKLTAKEQNQTHPEYIFTPHENPMSLVESALQEAKHQDKLLILVLGAQWCHDSRALAGTFSTASMQTIFSQSYLVQFIDVGYLEDRTDITKRFGYPNYFATPTVLVVDPKTEKMMNTSKVSIWQNAASLDLDTYQNYFSWLPASLSSSNHSLFAPSARVLRVESFASKQSARLSKAYEILGPMLKDYKDGTLTSRQKFDETWDQIKEFRTQLQADLVNLNQQANQADTELVFPIYPSFEWEIK